jgi:pyruvate formate lyase activating enzyme
MMGRTESMWDERRRQFLRKGCMFMGGAAAGMYRWGGVSWTPEEENPRWRKPAMFVRPEGDAVRCMKCPHGCLLRPGSTGRCRNRVNVGGTVFSTAYGNPCAVHVDPIEKKPFFHVLPTTRAFSIAAAGCNLRCLNCQNWQISQVGPEETENEDLMPAAVVERCVASGCRSIAYTYSEPTTFYEYTYDTARLARAKGIWSLLKSNGYINEEPLRRLCGVLDAANIDLKSFDTSVYARLSGGSLAPVLRTLEVLHQEGVWLEITCLLVPSWSDDPGTIAKMCDWLVGAGLQDCPIHFSRFVPLYKLAQLPPTPVQTLERAREVAIRAGLRYVYIGNVPGHEAESTFCHSCGKVIIERRGFAIIRSSLGGGKCLFCGTAIPGRWT